MKLKYDLRGRREELGLTLAQVAKKARLTAPGVRALERGLFQGKLGTRQRLADALGIPIRLLMTDAEQRVAFGEGKVVRQMQAFLEERKLTPDEAWAELRRLGRG